MTAIAVAVLQFPRELKFRERSKRIGAFAAQPNAARGNYGQNSSGAEQFGAIASPGNDPSVITVGSANSRNTILLS
jgi:hypothetical protein